MLRVPSCPSWTTSFLAQLVYRVNQSQHVVYGSFGEYSVAEIEDVTGPTCRLLQKAQGPGLDRGRIGKQEQRIEIPLNAFVKADPRPSLPQIHSPVYTDDITARLELTISR